MLSFQAYAQTITMYNNRIPRIYASPPHSPPLVSFVAALAIVMLIFMCIYVFSTIVSLIILLALYITSVFLFWFIYGWRELNIEMGEGERTIYAQTPQNNQRVVRILDKLFWVVEKRGNQRQQGSVKELIGSFVCFGSQAMASSCSDCAICLEDFKKEEECLVFPVCGHLFHSNCINHWLKKKPTCPVCRHCILSARTMITKTRSREFLASSV